MGVLKVKVGADWVPVVGGNEEVYVGASVPTGTEELWYDTAAVASSENALGIMAKGIMKNFVGTTLTANQNTKITEVLSFTPVVGRRYRLVCRVRAVSPSAAGHCRFEITGTNIPANDYYHWIQAAYQGVDVEILFDGTGVASTYQVGLFPSQNMQVYCDMPTGLFYIEDVGPVR